MISDRIKNCQTHFVYKEKWNTDTLRHLTNTKKQKLNATNLNVLELQVLASELKEHPDVQIPGVLLYTQSNMPHDVLILDFAIWKRIFISRHTRDLRVYIYENTDKSLQGTLCLFLTLLPQLIAVVKLRTSLFFVYHFVYWKLRWKSVQKFGSNSRNNI